MTRAVRIPSTETLPDSAGTTRRAQPSQGSTRSSPEWTRGVPVIPGQGELTCLAKQREVELQSVIPMKHPRFLPVLAACVAASSLLISGCATATRPAPAPAMPAGTTVHEDASAAIPKTGPSGEKFMEKHESFLKRGKEGPIGVLFIGDSITEGWRKAPGVWEEHYGRYQPANFGISGDKTQHVIWRIRNGELDGIDPKVVVMMLGTNNTGDNTGAEIAAADTKIIRMIHERLPRAKVLLLAIFPRGPRRAELQNLAEWEKRRDAIDAANARLMKLDNGSTVRYLDIGHVFFGPDGKIPDAIMPDQLHPNEAGYKLWADAMQPLLDEMMR